MRRLVLCLVSAALWACPSRSDAPAEAEPGSEGGTPQAPEPAAAEASDPAAPEASDPATPEEGSGPAPAVCPFLEAEQPIGGVRCPDNCVMAKAAQIDEERGCALVGPQYEIALACLRVPTDIQQGGRCYVNATGHHVVTALHYPAVLSAGWTECPEDYPQRSVAACPDPGDGSGSGGGVQP